MNDSCDTPSAEQFAQIEAMEAAIWAEVMAVLTPTVGKLAFSDAPIHTMAAAIENTIKAMGGPEKVKSLFNKVFSQLRAQRLRCLVLKRGGKLRRAPKRKAIDAQG